MGLIWFVLFISSVAIILPENVMQPWKISVTSTGTEPMDGQHNTTISECKAEI